MSLVGYDVFGNPVSFGEAARLMEERFAACAAGLPDPWRIAQDEVGDVEVSTVFLGIDHNWSGYGKPVLWETLIFGGPRHGEMARWRSAESAVAGHDAIVAELRVASKTRRPE